MSSRATALIFASLICHAAAGEDSGPFLIGTSKEVALRREKAAPPSLLVSPESIRATAKEGESCRVTLTIKNAGGQSLRWEIAGSPVWVRPSKRMGTLGFRQSEEVILVLLSSGLSVGTRSAYIRVEAANATKSLGQVELTFTVAERAQPKDRNRPGPIADQRSRRGVITTSPNPPTDTPIVGPRRKPRKPFDLSLFDPAFGIRAGYLVPTGGPEEGLDGSLSLAGTYSFASVREQLWEVSIEFGSARESSHYSSWPLGVRVEAIFGEKLFYSLIGGAGMLEFVTDNWTGEEYTNRAFALNVGAGFRIADGTDIRVRYDALLGSENIGGQAELSVGYHF